MSSIRIRPPVGDETPLSPSEQWVAIREGFDAAPPPKQPTWHPAVVANWSCVSAMHNRRIAVQHLELAGGQ